LRDDGTVLSKFLDTRDFEYVEFHVLVGATDITVDAKLQESVNADGSLASDVEDGAITQITGLGDNVMVVITAAKQALTKRYAGVLVTIGDGIAGANVAAEGFMWGGTALLPLTQEEAGSNSYATSQVIRVS
jgi:hypothetical protein